MTHGESAASSSMPKSVAGLAILLLVVAAFFGFLNGQKVKALRATVATSQAARDAAELRAREKLSGSTGVAVTKEEPGKVAEGENKAAKAEAQLAQIQKEKADLQAKLDNNQQEHAALQGHMQEVEKNPNASAADSPAAIAPATDLQSQVDD